MCACVAYSAFLLLVCLCASVCVYVRARLGVWELLAVLGVVGCRVRTKGCSTAFCHWGCHSLCYPSSPSFSLFLSLSFILNPNSI